MEQNHRKMQMVSRLFRPRRAQRITVVRIFAIVHWCGQGDKGSPIRSHLTPRLSFNSMQEMMHFGDLEGLSQFAKLVFRGLSNSARFYKS